MVIGKITSYLALGLVGAFLINAIARPQSALGTGAALQETGTGIASIGMGIGDSLKSIGQGSAKLLDPLFSLRDLINLPSEVQSTGVAGAANASAVAQDQGDTQNRVNTGSNTITWSSGSSASVPSLSAAAKSFYRSRGVSVT